MSSVNNNRLQSEVSPYLQQHADNPVCWQPWDKEARKAAKREDKPIFLSVGYSACHWCHVMEEESFSDPDIANRLNKSFIPIKVDREEHPAVDRVYQQLCQLVTGHGGWPLSIWLTPELKPFAVGTYYPPEERYGRQSFRSRLDDLVTEWETNRTEVDARADQWTTALEQHFQPSNNVAPSTFNLKTVATTAVSRADDEYGGWGNRTKFPHTGRIEALLLATEMFGEEVYRDTATRALEAMATGGLYDHVGGGFHRYATDREWTVPHFEKMLYDNAELLRVYALAYASTENRQYETVVRETADFLYEHMRHPDGGYYGTIDAQSDPPSTRGSYTESEGAYYTWTPDEIDRVLEPERGEIVKNRYGITPEGNFNNTTVLTISATIEELADQFSLSTAAINEHLTQAKTELQRARGQRPAPHTDKKVITAWNGLMIHSLVTAAVIFDDDEYMTQAEQVLSFIQSNLYDNGQLSRGYLDKTRMDTAALSDYAMTGLGTLAYTRATNDDTYVPMLHAIIQDIFDQFWDKQDGQIYYTSARRNDLIVRPVDHTDQSLPSSTGTVLRLLTGAKRTTSIEYESKIIDQMLSTVRPQASNQPLLHATIAIGISQDRYNQLFDGYL
ncbi:thioredoxin domain-containing protein [Salinarchaeum sp. IM2453]|uniref:thioredoxin domain-containing protein n=1 Tax=Salinarchaeum sp. IM2453 TaxID=2862870 RepID=UPI001C82E013|nr:thioredoxin domain-containing protein [Salinarchaeum sp. IM2453]QZA88346.1 thioredoxin domain-containing protein [Salinarchaeum sp. IM2453]